MLKRQRPCNGIYTALQLCAETWFKNPQNSAPGEASWCYAPLHLILLPPGPQHPSKSLCMTFCFLCGCIHSLFLLHHPSRPTEERSMIQTAGTLSTVKLHDNTVMWDKVEHVQSAYLMTTSYTFCLLRGFWMEYALKFSLTKHEGWIKLIKGCSS